MENQKIENMLNLALDATEEEREKSLELSVGYDSGEREWDLIVKYSGSLDPLRKQGIRVVELLNEFAILTVPESQIGQIAKLTQIEYIEKPKRLFFETMYGKRVSCITSVQDARPFLFGNGILVAVIDSGIDYANHAFRKADGSTRIRALWDQTIPGNPPEGYVLGTEFTEAQINEALRQPTRIKQLEMVGSVDNSGHGTAVTGIAAGSDGIHAGVATESELLIVKLGSPRPESFPRTTELMQGIDYVIRKAVEYQMPVAVNLSFGNTYGSHDGRSLLERFIDDISNYWKSVICVGSGNEGNAAGHTAGVLIEGQQEVIELAVQMRQPGINVQIWKEYEDVVDISIISPSGVQAGPIQEFLGPQRFRVGDTELLLYYGEPSPFSTAQEIFIEFLPTDTYITSGIWQIILNPRKIVSGSYAMWLPSSGALNPGTAFLYPQTQTTLTIPGTALRVLSVGAYNARTLTYADFSGRGYLRGTRVVKPDIVAPGVDVTAPVPGGTFAAFSGTSFATPFATGGAALMMEWGIVRENDPYLYGEKVKAYMRRGAKPLPGFTEYPNPEVGYGALCVKGSLPI